MRRGAIGAGWLIASLAALAAPPARADLIQLTNGQQLRGVVVPDPGRPDKVLVQTETSSRPLVFDADQVARVIEQADKFDDYEARRRAVAETAQAHFDLGQWCDQNGLTGLSPAHYRRAVELDPNFAPAQKKLGRVLHNGVWMTYDEQRRLLGLVRHKGKWIPREELERLDARAAASAELSAWARRIEVLKQQYGSGTSEQRSDAEARLREIRDPAAVPALVQVFGKSDAASRVLLVRLLAGIDGPEAHDALIERILAEDELPIRQEALEVVSLRRDRQTTARLLEALKRPDDVSVGRAAWALAQLQERRAVPQLVEALAPVETRTVFVPTLVPTNPGASISIIQGQSVPVLTGPAVGPNAVAYGATSIPYGTGFSMNQGGGYIQGPALPRRVRVTRRNPEVLAALKQLTGADFGYDTASWKRWLKDFVSEDSPTRRLVQP